MNLIDIKSWLTAKNWPEIVLALLGTLLISDSFFALFPLVEEEIELFRLTEVVASDSRKLDSLSHDATTDVIIYGQTQFGTGAEINLSKLSTEDRWMKSNEILQWINKQPVSEDLSEEIVLAFAQRQFEVAEKLDQQYEQYNKNYAELEAEIAVNKAKKEMRHYEWKLGIIISMIGFYIWIDRTRSRRKIINSKS